MAVEYEVKAKVALITGAGSGIGLTIAQRLLSEGCSVMIADLALLPEAEVTLAKYPNPSPDGTASAAFHQTDVSNWVQLSSLWETTLETFGRVDILVNNAGMYEPPESSFWNPPGISPVAKDKADAEIGSYQVFNVNTIGPIRLAQIAIDYWLQNREIKGNLLWICSMGGYIHSFMTPFYYASKAAMLSFVKSLQAFKNLVGIRNSAICPGGVRTPFFDKDFCRGRVPPDDIVLSPEDVANVAFSVLTEEQYGDGNLVELMMIGTKEEPKIHQKEVQLEALYPTNNPVVGKAIQDELDFMKLFAEKGMRSTC